MKIKILLGLTVLILSCSPIFGQKAQKVSLIKTNSVRLSAKALETIKKHPLMKSTLRMRKAGASANSGYTIYKIQGRKDFIVLPSKIDVSKLILPFETYKKELGNGVFWFTCVCPNDEPEGKDNCKVVKDGNGDVNVAGGATTACSGGCGEQTCALTVTFLDNGSGELWVNGKSG